MIVFQVYARQSRAFSLHRAYAQVGEAEFSEAVAATGFTSLRLRLYAPGLAGRQSDDQRPSRLLPRLVERLILPVGL